MEETRRLSIDQIASLAGCDVATVQQYAEAGIFDLATLNEADVTGLRLLNNLIASGIRFEVIAEMFAKNEISPGFLQNLTTFPVTVSPRTYSEAIAVLGLDPDFTRRAFVAAGIPSVDWDSKTRADDLEFLHMLAGVGQSQIPEDTILRVLRIFGYALRKNADAMRDLFREEVEDRNRITEKSFDRFIESSAQRRLPLQRAGLAVIGYLQRRFLEELVFANVITRFQDHLRATGRLETGAPDNPAVAFADIVNFTILTLEKGDREAYCCASRFEALSHDLLKPLGVRIVKSLGDGLLLHSPVVEAAVEGCRKLVELTGAAGLPEIRIGVAAGPVVSRDGDIFGATVNLAARLAEKARAGTILTHAAVVHATPAGGLHWTPLGRATLKGFDSMDVYSNLAEIGE
jgi:adenylate cyclase